jgi:hypothetical protein
MLERSAGAAAVVDEVRAGVVQAPAQTRDVAFDGPRAVQRRLVSPDTPCELVLGEDLGRVACERGEDLKLFAAEVDRGAVDVGGPGGGVDVQRFDLDVAASDVLGGAAGDRVDDGAQDQVAAVGGEVVVAAGLVGAQDAQLISGAEGLVDGVPVGAQSGWAISSVCMSDLSFSARGRDWLDAGITRPPECESEDHAARSPRHPRTGA